MLHSGRGSLISGPARYSLHPRSIRGRPGGLLQFSNGKLLKDLQQVGAGKSPLYRVVSFLKFHYNDMLPTCCGLVGEMASYLDMSRWFAVSLTSP